MGTRERRVSCASAGCMEPPRGYGEWCNKHRQRVRKHGDADATRWPPVADRLESKFVRRDGCWEWQGSLFGTGYGQFWHEGTNRLAHRVVYEALVGPIPAGLDLDHLCRNKACVNPAHLEPVTARENTIRYHRHHQAEIAA